jgi:NADPH2:quinone reductase
VPPGHTDLIVPAGKYRLRLMILLVAGYEAAGVVEAIGSGVAGFEVGPHVAALTVYGAFAEALVRGAARARLIASRIGTAGC